MNFGILNKTVEHYAHPEIFSKFVIASLSGYLSPAKIRVLVRARVTHPFIV